MIEKTAVHALFVVIRARQGFVDYLSPHATGGTMDLGLSHAIAGAVRTGEDLESLTRPLLELLGQISGLESTYLTEIREEVDEQEILIARNTGAIEVSEGMKVEWNDTLCKRSLDTGLRATCHVDETFPGSQIARDLGLQTYVSVPIVNGENEIVGTLCGVSGKSVEVSEPILELMEVFARLIADQRERDLRLRMAEHHAEIVEQRLSQRAVFLAAAEHKLKSPLTAILGWSSLLHEDWSTFDEEQRLDAIETIHQSSKQLRSQVDNLLDEAQAEVLVGELEITNVSIREVFDRVATEHKESEKQGFRFLVDSEDVGVHADKTALWQIVSHLVDNSIKYSDGGTLTLRTRTTGTSVSVEIADEGIGIPSNVDLFAPFTRSDDVVKAGKIGTGLGLHIVRNLAEAMHGTVSARNNAARGSTFSVVLPVSNSAPLLATPADQSK